LEKPETKPKMRHDIQSWAIPMLRWEDQLAVLCAKADKMFMRTVQQNVAIILSILQRAGKI
jgi:hypothetical protein